jgi:hypothetical protein
MMLGVNFIMPAFVQYIKKLEEENAKARQYWLDNGKLIEQRNQYATENKKLRNANDVLIDNIALIKKERNDLKRELNRVQYNMIKTIAIGLTEGDYINLSKIDQHCWREYVSLVIANASFLEVVSCQP